MRINFTNRSKMPPKLAAKMKPPRRDTLRYVFRLLMRFLAGQRKVFVIALVMLIAEAGTSVLQAYPLAYLIDYLQGNRPDLLTLLGWPWQGLASVVSPQVVTAIVVTVGMVLMTMINSLGDSLAEINLAQGGRMLGYNLRLTLYQHLQRLSLAFHDQRSTGDIMTRVTGDVSAIEDFVIGSLSDIVGSLLVLVGTLAFLVYQSWQVALVAAVIIPVMAVLSNYYSQRIKIASKQQRAREGDLASATQEMLASIRVIQTYNGGGQELLRFADHNQKNVAAALQAAGMQARFSWIVELLESLTVAAVVWLGLWLISDATITVGMLVLFIKQIQDMFKPTRKIIKEWNTIGKIYASVERIGELLDRKPAVTDAPDAIQAPPFRGHIEFQQVSFAYQSEAEEIDPADDGDAKARPAARQVLNGVDFEVALGEVLALVGHTGAGKSTIIQLLSRLYDPNGGRILIDGADIRSFTLGSLRSQISVVLQETILFNGTVADNIAYGRANATRDEIIQAAVQANAHEFIEKLSEGYDTPLGERGSNLSGGQRQRIAIARAFIRNTPILILDEPTTGLDPESSELVLLALRMLMRGKTTLIVSHDFKLVRQAAKIVVLKEGRIEQMGDHRTLLKMQGTYENLYTKQFGHSKAENDATSLMLKGSLYDLLHSPAFQQKWPAVRTAFDAEAMRVQLQTALFAADADYTIVRCKPGKATYLNEEGCLLRYDLQVQHTPSGQTESSLILARIFASPIAAESYLRERLMPLVAKMQGRPEIASFTQPVAWLAELNMAVSVFPIDGELPALITATNCQKMTRVFRETLPQDRDNHFEVEACTVESGHYGRQHRCVLRYEVAGSWADGNQREPQIVYGKVAADDRCKWVFVVLSALHNRLPTVHSSRRFRIPHILGYRPNLPLILLEAIPGTPQIPQLIQAQVAGTAATKPGALTLELALKDCAQVAVALHKTQIALSKPRTLEDELASLEEQLQPAQTFSLALAMQLQNVIRQLQTYAQQTKSLPLCLSHGDFTYTQLIFDDASCGLVDFDTMCEAEPALDLGQFLAYLRLTARKIQQSNTDSVELAADELCTLFLNTYLQGAGYQETKAEQLLARVAVYEIISLLRIALHSWQKLKGSRLELVMDLLEERIICLPSIKQSVSPKKQLKQRKPGLVRRSTIRIPRISSRLPGLPQP
ncbi:hypothetical protein BH10CHL1_BH10CHL1_40660 [soil metagenome]